MTQDLRIFISSPGDVTPERLIAKRVIERLAREFAYHCRIEPILWERQPLIATEHFQSKITPPSETDIVVMIVWSRLGSPLPKDKFPGPISQGVVTGTEWEFEDAVKSYKQRKLPDLLVYRKQATVTASLEDDAELERRRKQKRQLEEFIRHWFVDEAEGSFKAASHSFSDPATLEEMLETHLRELIRSRIDDSGSGQVGIRWHEGSPFRGLEAFEIKHAPIFFGRTRSRNELRELLVRQSARGYAFVLVFGASGSGKSSLVKAGLLPDLMLPGMVEKVGLCRVAMMRPSDNAEDLFAGLAAALLRDTDTAQATALPELSNLEYDENTLAAQLRDAAKAELPIRQGLQAAGKTAQLAEYAEARLTIVVDQLEEIFTYDYPAADRGAFIATLAALAKSGRVWVIATMRSDFFDRLATLTELAELSEGEGRYLLTPPSDAEIGQIIGQPAREAGLRFEQRDDGISLDEQLRAEASEDPSALPLLEFTLEQLWQQRTEQGMLTYEAYQRLGGMEGALGQHAEAVFGEQPPEVQHALSSVLRELVTVGQGEQGQATARTVPMTRFPQGTPQRQLIEAFIDPAARLFITDGDGDGARVRVAHEALLRSWPRAIEQIETDRQDLQVRARIEQAEGRWERSAKADKASLLLAPGLPLSEAEDLVGRRRDELEPKLVAYVDGSSKASVAQARRRNTIRTAVPIGALLLATIAGWFWVDAQRQDAGRLVQRLHNSVDATPDEFLRQIVELDASRHWVLKELTNELDAKELDAAAKENTREILGKQRADTAIALFHLRDSETAVKFLEFKEDPETLTQFVHRCKDRGVKVEQLVDQLHAAMNRLAEARTSDPDGNHSIKVTVCFGLLLALREYDADDELVQDLWRWYREDPSSGIHSACGWLLRLWGQADEVERVDRQLAQEAQKKKRWFEPTKEWFVLEINADTDEIDKADYFTFVVFEPGEFQMGSPTYEKDRNKYFENLKNEKIERWYALCDREVTHFQLKRMTEFSRKTQIRPGFPATNVDRDMAQEYCKKLTEYRKKFAVRTESSPIEFRLPLEKEWEFACRAGTSTRFSFGCDDDLFEKYGCLKLSVVAVRRPNIRGLFDVHGNAKEWCGDEIKGVVRGGGGSKVSTCRSAAKEYPNSKDATIGFRLCVTLPERE